MSEHPSSAPLADGTDQPVVGLDWSADEAGRLHRWAAAWCAFANIARRQGRESTADKAIARHAIAYKRGLDYYRATAPTPYRCERRGDPCSWGRGWDGRNCSYHQGCVYQVANTPAEIARVSEGNFQPVVGSEKKEGV